MTTNPIHQIGRELSRFAVNVDLVAIQVHGRSEPLTEEEAVALTIPVSHLRQAIDNLEEELHRADCLALRPR